MPPTFSCGQRSGRCQFSSGLITRAFFNRLETGVGLNVTTVVVLIGAYGLGRLVNMVVAMHNDVHFMFRLGALMRRNMFAGILSATGSSVRPEGCR